MRAPSNVDRFLCEVEANCGQSIYVAAQFKGDAGQTLPGNDRTGATHEGIGMAGSADKSLCEVEANGGQSLKVTVQFKGDTGQLVFGDDGTCTTLEDTDTTFEIPSQADMAEASQFEYGKGSATSFTGQFDSAGVMAEAGKGSVTNATGTSGGGGVMAAAIAALPPSSVTGVGLLICPSAIHKKLGSHARSVPSVASVPAHTPNPAWV